jgi:hypothetical protein
MKLICLIVALLLTTACDAREESKRNKIMDEIEANLKLPNDSLPLEKYARYYAEDKGRIFGAYTAAIDTRPSDFGCDEVKPDGTSKPVNCRAISDLTPGQRRWVSFSDWPFVSAEHCRAIQVVYNLKARAIEYLECAVPTH